MSVLALVRRVIRHTKTEAGQGSEVAGTSLDYLAPGEATRTPLSSSLQSNLNSIRNALGHPPDLNTRELQLGGNGQLRVAIAYLDGMVERLALTEQVLEPLTRQLKTAHLPSIEENRPLASIRTIITAGEVLDARHLEELLRGMLSGFCAVLAEGEAAALLADTVGYELRAVEEPKIEAAIFGPQEGFTEDLRVNISLLRRRIRSPRLRVERLTLGRVSQTSVAIIYIAGIASEDILRELRRRLSRIDTDATLEINYIQELVEDEPFSIFPTMRLTERPDITAAGLLEGSIAVIVNGSPFALKLPFTFWRSIQASEDYYSRYIYGWFFRLMRTFGLLIALTLPSIYIAVTTFHQEMIPTQLALSIAGAREGVPVPAFMEAVMMEVAIEILREAGVRLPRPVGPAVTIVGALIVGESAVRAGIVSPIMVIVVATTAIASFIIPVFEMGITMRLLRFPLMLLAASMGFFGIMWGLVLLLLHLTSLRSFGTPYMEPLAPLHRRDLKDVFVRYPWWAINRRPGYAEPRDTIRQAPGLQPGPENDKGGEPKQ